MGSMDLDELLSKRDEINDRLLHVVDAAASAWGVKVTRIEIKDIDPPRDLVDSMGRQMKAERDKRAQILEAEGLRQSEILKAEGEKQALILQAEGRREAAFRDAEARERSAEAEAKATEVVSKAIASGDVQAINYFVAQQYTQALEQLASAPNQKVLMLPVEAASLIGSLAGIAEIAKSTFGEQAARRGARRGGSSVPADRRHVDDHRLLQRARGLDLGGSSAWSCSRSRSWCRATFLVWFGIAAILTGALALVADLGLAGRGADLRRSWRLVLVLVGRRFFGRATVSKRPAASSTSAPCGWSAAATCSASRSSTARAASGSTTPTGGSPDRTCRPARGSGSSAPTARCSKWRGR